MTLLPQIYNTTTTNIILSEKKCNNINSVLYVIGFSLFYNISSSSIIYLILSGIKLTPNCESSNPQGNVSSFSYTGMYFFSFLFFSFPFFFFTKLHSNS